MIYPGNSLSNKAKYLFLCCIFLKQDLRQSKIKKKKKTYKTRKKTEIEDSKENNCQTQKQILSLPSSYLLAKITYVSFHRRKHFPEIFLKEDLF